MITDDELRERAEALVADHHDVLDDQFAFRGAQWDAGLATVQYPEGRGGLGLSPGKQAIVNDVLRSHGVRYDDLRINPIGIGMGAPTVLTYGSDALIDKHLRRIFTGEDIWCQLFSEPTNGSDVAGIPSRAVRDGDEWVVNGQKVWTTLAHVSSYGMLLTRTNPDVPKHKGLSYFILDMHAPGVEIRPLFQITGEAEFNEVFFTDVRLPDSMRLDDVGRGWAVSLTTLMNERVSIGGGVPPRNSGPIGQLLEVWADAGGGDAAQRDELTRLWISAEVNRLTNMRAAANRKAGTPGPEGSVGKLAMAELNKEIYSFAMNVLGAEGMLVSSYSEHPPKVALFGDDVGKNFLRARANSIEGGTSEVMRNILGERVLGLPGEVRVDKELPWSQVPRS